MPKLIGTHWSVKNSLDVPTAKCHEFVMSKCTPTPSCTRTHSSQPCPTHIQFMDAHNPRLLRLLLPELLQWLLLLHICCCKCSCLVVRSAHRRCF